MNRELFTSIPKVDEVLNLDKIKAISENKPRKIVIDAIRDELDMIRKKIRIGEIDLNNIDSYLNNIDTNVENRIIVKDENKLRRVVNATGIIIHTNLGRSLLSEKILDNMKDVSTNYSNLEYNLETGHRGSRYEHLEDIIIEITGGESAMVVNNNAAAVLLTLNSIARGREIIVSRGELIEIGGSFRIPDVMEQSGGVLKAVGTTNMTHLKDYENAIDENTAALLKVHTSNYKILGFTKEVDSSELYELKVKYNIPLIEDLGSGVLIDLEKYGLQHEPTVKESLEKGVDIVTFSGDKLLGGPQAGIIVGKKEYIEEMKRNPLTRALRVDKFTISALEETLKFYLDEEKAIENIPTLNMLTMSIEEINEKAEILKRGILEVARDFDMNIEIENDYGEVGGGSLPLEKLPTRILNIDIKDKSVSKFEEALRNLRIPIICRIQRDRILLDLRTVRKDEIELIVDGFKEVIEHWEEG